MLWAVSRLFGRDGGAGTGAGDEPVLDDADNLDLRLARGELDVAESRTSRSRNHVGG